MASEATKKAVRSNINMDTRVVEVADFKSEVIFDLWGHWGWLEATIGSEEHQNCCKSQYIHWLIDLYVECQPFHHLVLLHENLIRCPVRRPFLYRVQIHMYLFQTGPSIPDDEEGHLAYKLGDVIDHEFMKCERTPSSRNSFNATFARTASRSSLFSVSDKILATLGEGTFGKVVKVKELNS